MQKHGNVLQAKKPFRVSPRHPFRHSSRPQVASEQGNSQTVYPHAKVRPMRASESSVANEDLDKVKVQDHRIDIPDEKSDLLGYVVYSGTLVLVKNPKSDQSDKEVTEGKELNGVDSKLTTKALVCGSHTVFLGDIISVTYRSRCRHFTVHSYPVQKKSFLVKPKRTRKDFRFLAANVDEAVQWVTGFADQQCYITVLPSAEPSKSEDSDTVASNFVFDPYIRCKNPPTILVILNPRSGHGRSSNIYYNKVEPIFKLAGFNLKVVNTEYAGHARKLASTVDYSTCPDGIICVGGDGIVNEVVNGLLIRDDQKEAISIPIGIIPAGSDNSLVWTVLGVRDPASAALAIIKGGLTPTDVFAVEWIQTGAIHFGLTVSYYGFVSDVLELSGKYQKRFGPLRYFVAGFLKVFCLPTYNFEVEYLPALESESDMAGAAHQETFDASTLYPDVIRRSGEGLPRASSLSSIDSILTPSRMSTDMDTTSSTLAGSEPSDLVRCIDPKAKRLSTGRSNATAEPDEVIHPQMQLSATPNRSRTRTKTRIDKGWTAVTMAHDTRSNWGGNDKEDISSTISDPGPIWDAEPKWDADGNEIAEDIIQLPQPSAPEVDLERGHEYETPKQEEKWVTKKGRFLGVLVCNHECRTVQNLRSQVLAPKAEHDDQALDMLLVHGSGRLRLIRFFVLMQLGRHLSLPYVEYVKVKSVRIIQGKDTDTGCGIDGELLPMNGHSTVNLLPEQCRLIGRPAQERV